MDNCDTIREQLKIINNGLNALIAEINSLSHELRQLNPNLPPRRITIVQTRHPKQATVYWSYKDDFRVCTFTQIGRTWEEVDEPLHYYKIDKFHENHPQRIKFMYNQLQAAKRWLQKRLNNSPML